jgi:hypothetical protein
MSGAVYLPYDPNYQRFQSDVLVAIVERGGIRPFARFFAALELANRKEYMALHDLTASRSGAARLSARDALLWHTDFMQSELMRMLDCETRRFVFYETSRHYQWIMKRKQPSTTTA